MSFNIEDPVKYLLVHSPFHGEFIMGMKRIITTRFRAAAGVSVTESINLYINPNLFTCFNIKQQADILRHEVAHLMRDHISRASNLVPDKEQKHRLHNILNVSADLSINSYLPSLKAGAIIKNHITGEVELDEEGNPREYKPWFVENLQERFPDLKDKMPFEYYWDFFQNEGKDMVKNVECDHTHEMWDESIKNRDYVREKIRENANKAAANSAGKIPGNVLRELEELNKPIVNWRQHLRMFVSRLGKNDTVSTRKRRNRRYGIQYPGHKKQPELHLATVIDTSGSVTDDILTKLVSELNAIHKNGVKITVIHCDAAVHEVHDFNPNKKIDFKGGGGTLYQPGLDKAGEIGADGVIYFGDMYASDINELQKPNMPVLWVVYGSGDTPKSFGKTVRID